MYSGLQAVPVYMLLFFVISLHVTPVFYLVNMRKEKMILLFCTIVNNVWTTSAQLANHRKSLANRKKIPTFI